VNFFAFLFILVATYLRPVEFLLPDAGAYRPMVWASLLALIIALVGKSSGDEPAGKGRHFGQLGLLLLAIALSLISNLEFGGAVTALIGFGPNALLFSLALLTVNTLRRLKITIFVFVACIFVLSVAGVTSYYTGFGVETLVLKQNLEDGDDAELIATDESEIPAEDNSGKFLWRVTSFGLLADPNEFSQAIVVTLPLIAGLYVRGSYFRNMFLVALPSAFMLFTIYLTHSRGAILGTGALLFFGIRRIVGTLRTVVLIGAIGTAVMATNIAGGRAFSAQEESAGGRIDAWSEGLIMLRSHPALGVGYGHFTDHHSYTAHNSFVLCFAELGLIGYVIWLGMIVVPFKEMGSCIRQASPESEGRKWVTLLMVSFLGFLTCSFFLSRTYSPGLYMLMAFCICACYCARQEMGLQPAGAVEPEGTRWLGTSVQCALASLVVFFFIVRLKYATAP
jgi:putative inorganic carbon (hco3(-)) transporter